MLEKMLETLVRIAVALETIANKEPATTITETYEHGGDSKAKKVAELTKKVLDAEAEAAKKPEPKPETKKPETKKAAEDEVTFEQCKDAFLGLAKGLRDAHGGDKMKKITLGILNDFTLGQPLSAASLSEDKYVEFFAAVADAAATDYDQPEE